jgi:ATP-dependent DNA helicase RecQ
VYARGRGPCARRRCIERGSCTEGGHRGPATEDRHALDTAIIDVVERADPPVGRTRTVEILRGGRSKVIVKYGYDTLDRYGDFAALRADEVLDRVDGLLGEGKLRSTGGKFPKLAVAA